MWAVAHFMCYLFGTQFTFDTDHQSLKWVMESDKMVPSWHALTFLCLLGVDSSMEGHVTSYFSQRVDGQSLDPEVGDGRTDHHDVHDDILVLEFLRTSMVPGMVSAKERDRVLQRARRYWLEGTHILRVWENGKVRIVPHPAQRVHIVQHAHEELGHFGVK
jgi:hypothetical protein